MLKYVQLYEDYTKSMTNSINTEHSWQELRDTIQQKLPFIIIDFDNREDLNKCIEEELYDDDYSEQTYFFKNEEGETIKYPSVFIYAKGRTDLKDKVMNFYKRFDINRVIVGQFGKTTPVLYVKGESVEFKENLYSSLDADEMGDFDFYKMKSAFYKFID
jgi:hypothetical protein